MDLGPGDVPEQLLVFEVGGRTLGLPSSRVVEIVRAVAVTPLPRAPAIIEGVINVRGAVIPVIDLRARLGLPARPIEASDHFVLARAGERDVALHVDHVRRLMSLERARVEPGERVGWGVEHLAGVAVLKHGLVVILDLERFLTADEARALDEELTAAAGERA